MKKALKTAAVAIMDAPLKAQIALSTLAASVPSLALAEAANVKGALEQNQAGLKEVQNSSFTGAGVQASATNVTNAVLYAAGAIGIILVVVGIYQLWRHQKEGDQARGDMTQGVWMIVIGGIMTIPAIITAIAPNLFMGS